MSKIMRKEIDRSCGKMIREPFNLRTRTNSQCFNRETVLSGQVHSCAWVWKCASVFPRFRTMLQMLLKVKNALKKTHFHCVGQPKRNSRLVEESENRRVTVLLWIVEQLWSRQFCIGVWKAEVEEHKN